MKEQLMRLEHEQPSGSSGGEGRGEYAAQDSASSVMSSFSEEDGGGGFSASKPHSKLSVASPQRHVAAALISLSTL